MRGNNPIRAVSQLRAHHRRVNSPVSCVALGVLALTMLLPAPVRAQDCIDYSDFMHVEGSVELPDNLVDVTVDGEHAYVTAGSSLQVIDLADAAAPTIAGSVDLPDEALSVATAGGYVYVGGGTDGLHVIDATDPTAPSIAATYNTTGYADGVEVVGSHAYVCDQDRFLVFDVSSPEGPELIGTSDADALDVAVTGDYAYATDGEYYLMVIDISDPTSPSVVRNVLMPEGYHGIPTDPMRVALAGDYAYVSVDGPNIDDFRGLAVVDISVPSSADLVGELFLNYCPGRLAAAESLVYIDGLNVIDVSVPTSPLPVWSIDIVPLDDGEINSLAQDGDYVYAVGAMAEDEHVFLVVDRTNTDFPTVGSVGGGTDDVAVAGNYAYTVDRYDADRVIDVSDPTQPHAVAVVDLPSGSQDIEVAGSYAYVANGGDGLQIVDISNPESPWVIGSIDTPAMRRVTVAGSHAYVAAGNAGLLVIDTAEPAAPVIVGTVTLPHSARDVDVAGSHAHVATGDGGLTVVDISNPEAPAVTGSVGLPDAAEAVAVRGDHAYVGARFAGLHVVDITDPANPTIAGSLGSHFAFGVVLSGSFAYVQRDMGLRHGFGVVDISDPTSPVNVGSVSAPGGEGSVTALNGNYAYAACASGMYIVPRQCEETTAVSNVVPGSPGLNLYPSSPNPFNTSTTWRFDLGEQAVVTATIHDATGRAIRTLLDARAQQPREHMLSWDGRDDRGRELSSGVYFYRLRAGKRVQSRTLVMVK